ELLWSGRPALSALPWICGGLVATVLLWQAARLLDQLWWRPRRLERALRSQGLRGTRYRFLLGDVNDYARQTKEASSGPPMPPRCHDVGPRAMPFLYSTIQEHGAPCISWFGPVPKVSITDPALVREVMSSKLARDVEKFKFPALTRLLADGVGNYEGDRWAKHRRILNPAFHAEKLKNLQLMLPAFTACCEELVGRWEQSLGPDGSWEVDVCPELQSLTGDVISQTAFGSSYLEGRRIFQLQTEQIGRFMAAVNKIMIPGYMSFPTKNNRRMHQINKEIESILRGIIAKRMQAIQEGESTKDDLLGLLLESNMSDTDENGQSTLGMSADEVTMILYEVLRLYPPATVFTRKTYKKIEIGGITYPAGVMFEMPVLYIHHDTDIWGEDVHQFKPDRFAEGISKASKDPGAFFPFGWGPRICIGQNFALLEAKMALCMILQRFEFELAPSYTHTPHSVMMLRPMHGAPIRLHTI
uniref:Cytochrome P450 n=1 Tax=Aegilops tauschii subsp. strangulata TaxID=200361 RepID=A0A452ZMB1_AEGTS